MIAMSERCGCGTELRVGLPFCVACGSRRPAPLAAGPSAPFAGDVTSPAPNARHSAPTMRRPVALTQTPYAGGSALGPDRVPTQRAAVSSGWPPYPPAAPQAPYGFSAHPVPAAHHGAPARSSAPWIVAAAGIVVVAVVAAVLVVVMRPAVVYGAAPSTPTAPPVVVTAGADTSTDSTSETTPSPTGGGTATLQATVDADRSSVESLDGMWVAQLSSKRPGTVADGTTYDASAIDSHYRALASAHPGALLLWSGDWSVYKESDYWVVVEGQGFTTAAGANAWCSAQGFGADDCFAKRLSHTDGPAGSTVPRS